MSVRIFIHGLESSGSGYKGRFFRKIFPDILTPDFKGSLEERLEALKDVLKKYNDIKMIGSSFGGLMATVYALEFPHKVSKLILLAPALSFGEYLLSGKTIYADTTVYHGINDSVVPLEPVKKISEKIFKKLKFYEVADDHLLHNTIGKINWKEIL